MAPILPGLSDRPEQLAEVVRAAREAGATGIWANLLYLRPGTREHFLEQLARDWPEQLDRYEALYARRAYLAGRGAEARSRTQDSPAAATALRRSATARPVRPAPRRAGAARDSAV